MLDYLLYFTVLYTTVIKSDGFEFEWVLSESKPLEDYVKNRGYPFENHLIYTNDGYVLTYHRVPHGCEEAEKLRDPENTIRHPILLVHGILQSSAFFLAIEDGLAFKLADAGFDVWLANHRGNPYSKGHMHFKSHKHAQYWEFSFHEMGKFDLPVAIDYILEKTGKRTLTYVGFSMGTTMFWVLADSWPEYMSKVDNMVAIAPIARPSGLSMVMSRSSYGIVTTILKALNVLHFFEFRPYRRREANVLRIPCNDEKDKHHGLCKLLVKIVCYFSGMQENLLDYKTTLKSLEFMSAGSSIQSLYHLLQVGSAGKFQRYDYGDEKNMKYYGGVTNPPEYNLKKVNIPLCLIQGGKDEYSVVKDTEWLAKQFGTKDVKFLFQKEAQDFNHLDFFFANEVNKKVYKPLVETITEAVDIMYALQKDYESRKDNDEFLPINVGI